MAELVISGKRELQSNAESLDRHDGNGADGGADGEIDECVVFAVLRRDPIDHEDGKGDDGDSIQEES